MIYGVIYCLTNEINGKQYFGQTIQKNIEKYWRSHKNNAKNGSTKYLHNAIRKYGWVNFKKEVICKCGDGLSLGLMEDLCIQVFNTLAPAGYNLRRGGVHGKLSEETKQKISIGNKGKKLSEEHKQKIKDSMPNMSGENNGMFKKPSWNKGRKNVYSEETLQKMENAHFGKKLSKNHKQAISNGMLKSEKYKKGQKKIHLCLHCNRLFDNYHIKRHIKACSKNINRIVIKYK